MIKVFALSIKKLRAMSGGLLTTAAVLALSALMFLAAHGALTAQGGAKLKLAAVDNANSVESKAFLDMLTNENGSVSVLVCKDMRETEKLEYDGRIEGTLVIDRDFSEKLMNGGAALDYYPAKGVSSSEAAKEFISGTAVVFRSRLNAPEHLEKLKGAPLTAEEQKRAGKAFSDYLASNGAPVEILRSGDEVRGGTVLGAFSPRYAGFTAFIIMLAALMLGVFFGSDDARAVSARMRSAGNGLLLDVASDFTAIMLFEVILFAISLLVKRELPSAFSLLCAAAYLCVVSALAVLIGSVSSSARSEISVPVIAFITSLAGGCFNDLSSIEKFKTLSLFTPQGQYLSALDGKAVHTAVLFALAVLFAAASLFLRKTFRKGTR